jgi:hypothetical protein
VIYRTLSVKWLYKTKHKCISLKSEEEPKTASIMCTHVAANFEVSKRTAGPGKPIQ